MENFNDKLIHKNELYPPQPFYEVAHCDEQQATFQKLTTMTGTTLMATEFEPLSFAVDQILPQGVFILAGSGKIGKSWLSLE